MKKGKKKALSWSFSLNQVEFGVDEQRKAFTKCMWLSVINADCHPLLGWLSTEIPELLMWPDAAKVGKECCGEVG